MASRSSLSCCRMYGTITPLSPKRHQISPVVEHIWDPRNTSTSVFLTFQQKHFFTSSCPNRRGDDYLCVWTCSSAETYSIYSPAAFLHCGHNQFFSPTTNFQFFLIDFFFFTHKSSDIFCCQRVQQVQSLYVCQCVYRVDFILIIKQLIIKSVILISSWPAC